MQKYEIGERFPLEKYLNRGELTVAILNEGFFDVLCCISKPLPDEIRDFRKGKLTVYLYENSHVPFVIFDMGFNFDVSLNLSLINNEQQQDNWLNSEANVINMYLVDADTGILSAMRMISIPVNFAEKIRDICELQLQNDVGVDRTIIEVMNTLSTEDMMKRAIFQFKFK